jgi:hypothetical protein
MDVLEEVTGDPLTPDHVEARIADWKRRIADLYAMLTDWLPEGWTAREGRTIPMFEQPMREIGARAHELVTLDLIRDGRSMAMIVPETLWIVGANGRLALWSGRSHYYITDRAEIFESPKWMIQSIMDRRDAPLDQAAFESALNSA